MLNSQYRRKIDELIARYIREPDLRDIYVEGESDKALLEWILHELDIKSAKIYEISTVEVPADQVLALGLKDNNRNRVITLSQILSQTLPNDSKQATFIYDRDTDIINDLNHKNSLLLGTDFSCLEMYFFDEKTLTKLFHICVRNLPSTTKEIIDELVPILEDLFIVRVVNENLSLSLSQVNIHQYCSLRPKLVFDLQTYIRNYLISNSRGREFDNFMTEFDAKKEKLTEDFRMQINGHDFVKMLSIYIGLHRPGWKQSFTEPVIERMLATSVELNDLKQNDLIKKIIERVS